MDEAKRQRLEQSGWKLGSADEFLELSSEESAELDRLHSQYEAAHRQVMEQARVGNLDQLETEEDILAEAIRLTHADYTAFSDAVNAPSVENDKLRQLLEAKSPWE